MSQPDVSYFYNNSSMNIVHKNNITRITNITNPTKRKDRCSFVYEYCKYYI